MIFFFAIISFDLGVNLVILGREYVHGDPYHTKHLWAFSAVAVAAAILVIGLWIHLHIKRLSALAGEGTNDRPDHL